MKPRDMFRGFVSWEGYDILHLPRKFFKVRRNSQHPSGKTKFVTIHDVFGFFQTSFANALKDWEVGDKDELERIEKFKADRGNFNVIDDDIIRYNQTELILLSELMTKFREKLPGHLRGIRSWQGAGNLASQLLRHYKVPKREDGNIPERVERYAFSAYFGGRFETAGCGYLAHELHEHDISSAYPYAMTGFMPCPLEGHTIYKFGRDREPPAGHPYIADVTFEHPYGQRWHGLPVRQKEGAICWPRIGRTRAWNEEIEAAAKLGCKITRYHSWCSIERNCLCDHFAWVTHEYQERQRIAKEIGKAAAIPYKLALNSVYGKTGQSIGGRPYGNFLWASLTTMRCRALVLSAIATAPNAIVMVATDGVYSTEKLPLNIDPNKSLGSWEYKSFPDYWIVQPGFGWCNGENAEVKTVKSRGISKRMLLDARASAEAAWQSHLQNPEQFGHSFEVPVNLFISFRSAISRRKLLIAGMWQKTKKVVDFDVSTKRGTGTFYGAWYDAPPKEQSKLFNSVDRGEKLDQSIFDELEYEAQDQPEGVIR
jgi:hypothetical protein